MMATHWAEPNACFGNEFTVLITVLMVGGAQQLRPACACCPCRRVEIRVRDLPRDQPLEDWFTVEVGVQPLMRCC